MVNRGGGGGNGSGYRSVEIQGKGRVLSPLQPLLAGMYFTDIALGLGLCLCLGHGLYMRSAQATPSPTHQRPCASEHTRPHCASCG